MATPFFEFGFDLTACADLFLTPDDKKYSQIQATPKQCFDERSFAINDRPRKNQTYLDQSHFLAN
jgi:hypothetical protein